MEEKKKKKKYKQRFFSFERSIQVVKWKEVSAAHDDNIWTDQEVEIDRHINTYIVKTTKRIIARFMCATMSVL